MISIFRNKLFLKTVVVYVVVTHLLQVFFPNGAYALTSGPSQPEVQGFTPAGVSELVNVSTGDFSYNIPLMSVEGYPINLSYNSGRSMEEEASMVGLGWNLNIGQVTRNMRGLPDDFAGDVIKQTTTMKENVTVGLTASKGLEIGGADSKILGKAASGGLKLSLGFYRNNRTGLGFEAGVSPSVSIGDKSKGALSLGLGLSAKSSSGIDVNPSLGFSKSVTTEEGLMPSILPLMGGPSLKSIKTTSFTGSANYNSRAGLKSLGFGLNIAKEQEFSILWGLVSNRSAVSSKGIGSAYSFGSPSYSPSPGLPFKTLSFSFSASTGPAAKFFYPNYGLQIYSTVQFINPFKQTVRGHAYGYMNHGMANELPEAEAEAALLDFNREKEGPFFPRKKRDGKYEGSQFLPLAQQTYDMFQVSAQGIGGQFRAHRSDVGTVYSPVSKSNSDQGGGGLEFGAAPDAHLGVNVNYTHVWTRKGKWEGKGRDLQDALSFTQSNSNNTPDFEPYYFKQVGERSVETDEDFQNKIGGEGLVQPELYKMKDGGARGVSTGKLLADGSPLSSFKTREQRSRRNQLFSTLSVEEANIAGLDKQIRLFKKNEFNYNQSTQELAEDDLVPRYGDGIKIQPREMHHISEITVTNPGGNRYVFGIPAYNLIQKEMTFTTDHLKSVNSCENLVDYDASDLKGNSNGVDEYYQEKITPSYAHAFLLTGIVSPDYVDREGDGITADDYGTAHKFNYFKNDEPFKWRTPYATGQANWQEGFESKTGENGDDKASIVYGEKELWFPHSIESKHFVAEFVYYDAADLNHPYAHAQSGWGVKNEYGDKETNTAAHPQVLKKIRLFSKAHRTEELANANPIKEVHFSYTYDLCKQVPNGNGTAGKLTLEKVWFTYGNSNEASLNPYEFTYNSENPNYTPQSSDAWGNYKPNDCSSNGLPNKVFPFVDQSDRATADQQAAAWELVEIKTPSGGLIAVEYEAKDYAYVQDQRAMQMFTLLGAGPDNDIANMDDDDLLYKDYETVGHVDHNFLFVQLDNTVTDNEEFKQKYLGELVGKDMYYNLKLAVNRSKANTRYFERMAGFAVVKSAGLTEDGSDKAWIELAPVNIKDRNETSDRETNPICFDAWMFIRNNLNEYVYLGSNTKLDATDDPESIGKKLFSFGPDISGMFIGFTRMMQNRGFANTFLPSKSWVRLQNPNGKKVGGGARVKQVTLTDNWQAMTGGKDATYGQQYEYTMDDPELGEISSGVAANEPGLARAENPLVQPIRYTSPNALSQNDFFMMEGPIGETFLPGPQIVYSRVKVSDLQHANITHNGTGHVVHEFYTAKDYPAIISHNSHSPLDDRRPVNLSILGLGIVSYDYYTGAQGYVIRLNDMHGKSKGMKVYAEGQTEPLSGVDYFYRTAKLVEDVNGNKVELGAYDASQANQLYNEKVPIIDEKGEKDEARVGVEIDFVVDEQEEETESVGFTASFNLDVSATPIPFPLPSLFGLPAVSQTRFRSLVTTKVVRHFGLIEKVVTYTNGASSTAYNEAWDAETGQVLATKTLNEFDDPVYSFNYPAHWYYDQLRGAYHNDGATWYHKSIADAAADGKFIKGDVLLFGLNTGSGMVFSPELGWVLDPDPVNPTVVTKKGVKMSNVSAIGMLNNVKWSIIKVVRSGLANQQSVSMGSFTAKADPYPTSSLNPTQILGAGAVKFTEQAQQLCGVPDYGCHCQPSAAGMDFMALLNVLIDNGTWLNETQTTITNISFNGNANLANSALGAAIGAVAGQSQWYQVSYPPTSDPDCRDEVTITIGQGASTLATIELTKTTTDDYCLDILQDFDDYRSAPVDPQTCTPETTFVMDGSFQYVCDGEVSLEVATFEATSSDFPTMDCEIGWSYPCGNPGDIVNPFLEGLLGNWRTDRAYTYLTGRTAPQLDVLPVNREAIDTDIANDGVFTSFSPFYQYNTGTQSWEIDETNWTWAARATKNLAYGQSVEEQDPLGRYSAALLGYKHQLPIAVVGNARYTEAAYAHFEDTGELTDNCEDHIQIDYSANSELDFTDFMAHSGKQSVRVQSGENLTLTAPLNLSSDCDEVSTAAPYYRRDCDCAGAFSPNPGAENGHSRYVANFWVKSEAYGNGATFKSDYDAIIPEVKVAPISGPVVPLPIKYQNRSPLIDGWMRIEIEFDLGGVTNPRDVQITIKNQLSNYQDAYIDDLRIHPFHASMATYVYDPVTLKLMAQGDANGYCTFYQYDNREGALKSVKRETERGIVTLQSSESHASKVN